MERGLRRQGRAGAWIGLGKRRCVDRVGDEGCVDRAGEEGVRR